MNKTKEVFLKQLENKLNQCTDGYFELYKKVSTKLDYRKYTTYQYVLDYQNTDSISEYSNSSNFFFGVFLSLMMRYTQNEQLTGIKLQEVRNKSSIFVKNVIYNNTMTFNDEMKLIMEEKSEFLFENKWLNDIVLKIASYTDCLFVYTDSLEGNICVDARNIQTDICFHIVNKNEKKVLNIIYNENAYDKELICRMALHYEKVISLCIK